MWMKKLRNLIPNAEDTFEGGPPGMVVTPGNCIAGLCLEESD